MFCLQHGSVGWPARLVQHVTRVRRSAHAHVPAPTHYSLAASQVRIRMTRWCRLRRYWQINLSFTEFVFKKLLLFLKRKIAVLMYQNCIISLISANVCIVPYFSDSLPSVDVNDRSWATKRYSTSHPELTHFSFHRWLSHSLPCDFLMMLSILIFSDPTIISAST